MIWVRYRSGTSLVRLRYESGMGLVWVWYESDMSLVQVQYESGTSPVWVRYESGLSPLHIFLDLVKLLTSLKQQKLERLPTDLTELNQTWQGVFVCVCVCVALMISLIQLTTGRIMQALCSFLVPLLLSVFGNRRQTGSSLNLVTATSEIWCVCALLYTYTLTPLCLQENTLYEKEKDIISVVSFFLFLYCFLLFV